MYIKQRKLVWNKYFPQSVKTWVSEDLNSSMGTDGLMNNFSLPKTTDFLFLGIQNQDKYKNVMPVW